MDFDPSIFQLISAEILGKNLEEEICRNIRRKSRKKRGSRFDTKILNKEKFPKHFRSICSVLFLEDTDLVSNPMNNMII